MQKQQSFREVLANRGFLNLWINQVLVQLAYNSLNFALIVWVFKLTDSTTAVSALLLAVYLPTVLFGFFTGVLVDILDRKKIISFINLFLSISFLSLIFFKTNYYFVLFIAFFINTLTQFYIPAESSAIPIITKKDQLFRANSLFSITLFISFLLGFGMSGPLITHFGINVLFGLEAAITLVAFILASRFPSITNKTDLQGLVLKKALKNRDFESLKRVIMEEVKETVRSVRIKLPIFSAILIMSGVQMVIGVLAVLVPSFFEKVLHIKATEVSLVMVLPLGLGTVIGAFLIGKIGHKFPRRMLVGRAILLAGLLMFLVGVAPLVSPAIRYSQRVIRNHKLVVLKNPRPLPFFYQPPLSAVMAFGSFLMGIALVSIVVPSQTVLQENTLEGDRGKVFSALGVAMAGMTLLPVLFAGILADAFGTQPLFMGIGGTIALFGLLALKPDFFFAEHHLPFNVKEFLGRGHWRKKVKSKK